MLDSCHASPSPLPCYASTADQQQQEDSEISFAFLSLSQPTFNVSLQSMDNTFQLYSHHSSPSNSGHQTPDFLALIVSSAPPWSSLPSDGQVPTDADAATRTNVPNLAKSLRLKDF